VTAPAAPTPEELLELAAAAAGAAAALLAPRSGQAAVTATKTSPTDLVTADDTAAERLIRTTIARVRPTDAFTGEELGDTPGEDDGERGGAARVRWVVDPIDGTVNYFYGLPTWSVSVAAEVDGTVVAGVVEAPLLRRRYTALRGGGSWCNGVPLVASSVSDLAHALLATGFSYEADRRAEQAAALARLLPSVRDVRRLGSAALDLCLLGAGEVDCYYERGPKEYDRAAGMLVASEAGATVGVDDDLTWGAAAPLAEQFVAALRAAGG